MSIFDDYRARYEEAQQDEMTIQEYLANSDNPDLRSITATHPLLWLGDFDKTGEADDGASSTIISWERFPPGFRNSPGFKRKLERNGALAYWRTHGMPPQCRAVGAKDFTCD